LPFDAGLKAYIDTRNGGYEPTGVAADGTTNDRAAIVTAAAAASAAGQALLLPFGTIRNTGAYISLPAGLVVIGCGIGATIWDGPGFEMSSDNTVRNMTFTGTHCAGTDYGVFTRGASPATDCEVRNCSFTLWPGPAVKLAAAVGGGATRCNVTECQFTNNGEAVFVERAYYCRTTDNRSKNAAATGAHFTVMGGAQGCQWTNNNTEGGITGILLLAAVSIAGGTLISQNVITGNQIRGTSEEGISLDCDGGSAATTSVIDWGTVSAKSWASGTGDGQLGVTLDAAFAGIAAGKFAGYHMVVTSGAAAGAVFSIDSDNGSTQMKCNNTRNSVYNNLAVGDEVVIGNPMVANVITGNTVEDAGTSAIMVWGFAVGNVIADNTCYSTTGGYTPKGGLTVWGLDGLVTSSGAYTTRLGRSPVLLTQVRHNTLDRADLTFSVFNYGGAGYTLSKTNVQFGNSSANADVTYDQVKMARASRASSNVTINSVTFVAVDTGTDVTLTGCLIGDWIEVGLSAFVSNEAVGLALDTRTMISGSPVNSVGMAVGGAALPTAGILAWQAPASVNTAVGGSVIYQLVAGDITATGTVLLRLYAKTATAVNKVIVTDSNDPMTHWARNHGRG